jgi:uncharacterized protein YjbJ (UPF0337 family)
VQLAGQVLLSLGTEGDVNKDILKGKWLQVKGDIRAWWGKLTDDDVDQIQGNVEKFIGKLQERYGYGREQAEKEINDFLVLPDNQRQRRSA